MFSFIMPNGIKIDMEGLTAAFVSATDSECYFLDGETGQVGCCDQNLEKGKIEKLRASSRYMEVPKISKEKQIGWLREFGEMMLKDPLPVENAQEAKSLYRDMQKEMQNPAEDAFDRIMDLLEKDEDGWIGGWHQWQGDCLFDEAAGWLFSLPLHIEEKFEADCDCPLCQLLEKGPHSVGDFNEAASKIKKGRKSVGSPASFLQEKTYADAENNFVEALKKCHMDTFFSIKTFKKWLIDEKKYDMQFAPRALFFLEPDEADFAATKELFDASMRFANVVPRKSLHGKTPQEASKESAAQITDIEVSAYSKDSYLEEIERAHALMAEADGKAGYAAFEAVVQRLFSERTPFFHIFRVYANAAVCCFNSDDWSFGEELLMAALRINPSYDFALRQKERYVDPYHDLSGISKKDRKFTQSIIDIQKGLAARKYKRSVFAKYERFLKDAGISLDYKAQIKITAFTNDGQKIERNDLCYCGSGKKFKKCHGK
jgi:hypothetical protein